MSEEKRDIFAGDIFLLYGRPKIGKSTLANCFNAPVFCATEPGLKYVKGLDKSSIKNVTNFTEFLKFSDTVRKGGHPYKTIVIDTIDNLCDYCNDFVCDKNGIDHPSAMAMGKGWSLVTGQLKRSLQQLAMSGYCVIFISHEKLIEVKSKTSPYHKSSIMLSGKNREAVLNMVDHILFLDSDDTNADKEERRVIRTCGSKYWEAGSRLDELTKAGTIPLEFGELEKYFINLYKTEEV